MYEELFQKRDSDMRRILNQEKREKKRQANDPRIQIARAQMIL